MKDCNNNFLQLDFVFFSSFLFDFALILSKCQKTLIDYLKTGFKKRKLIYLFHFNIYFVLTGKWVCYVVLLTFFILE